MKTLISPKMLGDAIGVSESSLKRWVDDGRISAQRTEGGHRRIELAEAIRFIRDSRYSLQRPELLGLSGMPTDNGEAADEADLLLRALMEGRDEEARGMVLSRFMAGESLAALFDGPMRSALEHLGTLWLDDERGIFLEHRATDICIQAVNQVRSLIAPPADDAPVAVGAAPVGDPYILPSLMAAAVLADEGFKVSNLGANTPAFCVLEAARTSNARLAWMSITGSVDVKLVRKEVERLANGLHEEGVALVLGGQKLDEVAPALPPNAHAFGSMRELLSFARAAKMPVKRPAPAATSEEPAIPGRARRLARPASR